MTTVTCIVLVFVVKIENYLCCATFAHNLEVSRMC